MNVTWAVWHNWNNSLIVKIWLIVAVVSLIVKIYMTIQAATINIANCRNISFKNKFNVSEKFFARSLLEYLRKIKTTFLFCWKQTCLHSTSVFRVHLNVKVVGRRCHFVIRTLPRKLLQSTGWKDNPTNPLVMCRSKTLSWNLLVSTDMRIELHGSRLIQHQSRSVT